MDKIRQVCEVILIGNCDYAICKPSSKYKKFWSRNIIKEILKNYNQEHLLFFYDELSENEKDILINQILNIDFEKIINLYLNSKKDNKSLDIEISPLSHIEKDKLTNKELDYYTEIGEAVIKNNQVAVVTMAGGQGTRLRLQRSKRYLYAKFETN